MGKHILRRKHEMGTGQKNILKYSILPDINFDVKIFLWLVSYIYTSFMVYEYNK